MPLCSPANVRRLPSAWITLAPAISKRTTSIVRFVFTPHGWEDYVHWQTADRAREADRPIADDIARYRFSGIGKPERSGTCWRGAGRPYTSNIVWCSWRWR